MFAISLQDTALLESFSAATAVANRETTSWLVDMAMWMKTDLQRRVPVKTGALKSSIRYDLNKTATGGDATFFSIFYGKYVDEGTKPFTIHATSKPMVFYKGSDQIFTMTVRNPGIKPRNFTLETLDAAETEAARQMDDVADRVFKAVIG